MTKIEMIDMLYNFIANHFKEYYWTSARKYKYYFKQFAHFDHYNDFLLTQELTLHMKTLQQLEILINIMFMIQSNHINIMDCNDMLPRPSSCFVFDEAGDIIIMNEK